MDVIVPRQLKRNAIIGGLFFASALYAHGVAALAVPVSTTPSSDNPTNVYVGVVIRNLVAIDEVKENWQVTGVLVAKWNDPKLKYRPRGRGEFYKSLPATFWKPNFEFTNEDRPTDFRFVDFYVQPDGTVVYTQTFNAMLSTDLNLRRFPFDSQFLPLLIQARGEDLDRTILKTDPADTTLPKRAYAGLAQWIPVALTERLGEVEGSAGGASDVEVRLQVRRSPNPYILKFIVPLLLLVIISWITFWLSHEEFKTKDQLTSAVSTLLIIVAFNITATSVLPKTDYITYIDALLFTCFVFVILSIGTIVGIHLLQINHSVRRALTVRRVAGLVLPIAFLLTQAWLFVRFDIAG